MEKKRKVTDDEIIMETYKELYAVATPPADFEKLINECVRYIDMQGKIHFTETPLSKEECIERKWQKDIEYMNYELDENTFKQIVEDKIKMYKLKGIKAEAFKNTIYLGCGPKFK